MNKRSKKPTLREVSSVPQQVAVDIGEVMVDVGAEFRELLVRGGVAIAAALFRDETDALCGPRYARGEGLASRWGTAPGEAVLGGRRVTLKRPRVRDAEGEVDLESYRQLQREDPLTSRAVEQMLIGVSTRKYARSLEPVPVIAGLEEFGTSKSAVSRRFVARTQAQLSEALSRPLGDKGWAALLIDGIAFHDHVVVIVLGIEESGMKSVLGFREGTTENATLCRELLSDIVARGVPADRSIVVGIDGGKGLRKAVSEVFGQFAAVQRCQVHKKRNVLDQLPETMRAQVRATMSQAYAAATVDTALAQLKNLERTLAKTQPSAASSLREGLEETLTVKGLGITGRLAKTLETTNPIENLNGGVRRVGGRVKRCPTGAMALRWVATAALDCEKTFRRVRGHKDMHKLIAALRARDANIKRDNVRAAC